MYDAIDSSKRLPPTRRLCDDDAAERDHRDLARPAADVDDHVPGRSADRDVGPDRRRQGLLDQVRLAGALP
jgi:hypothetical protein